MHKAQRLRDYFGERGTSGIVSSPVVSPSTQRVSKSRKGPDFEQWAAEHVFQGKRRVSVPLELNKHLEHIDIEGHGLLCSRDSDNYIDADGSLWDAKAYSENSAVDLDQLRDYNIMQDAGYIFDNQGQQIRITSINYLFNSHTAAEKNFDHLFDGGANVWYVEWHEDGTGEIKLMALE